MLFNYSTSCTARLWSILVYSYTLKKISCWWKVTCFLCQIQGDKEKLLYELDSVQAELEKCRMISERWDSRFHYLRFKYFIFIFSLFLSGRLFLECHEYKAIDPTISRLQKEKEDALADIDCKREQYDKLQVGSGWDQTHSETQCWADHQQCIIDQINFFFTSFSQYLFVPLTEQRLTVSFKKNPARWSKDQMFPKCKMRLYLLNMTESYISLQGRLCMPDLDPKRGW